jgi:hypothetical protein
MTAVLTKSERLDRLDCGLEESIAALKASGDIAMPRRGDRPSAPRAQADTDSERIENLERALGEIAWIMEQRGAGYFVAQSPVLRPLCREHRERLIAAHQSRVLAKRKAEAAERERRLAAQVSR